MKASEAYEIIDVRVDQLSISWQRSIHRASIGSPKHTPTLPVSRGLRLYAILIFFFFFFRNIYILFNVISVVSARGEVPGGVSIFTVLPKTVFSPAKGYL